MLQILFNAIMDIIIHLNHNNANYNRLHAVKDISIINKRANVFYVVLSFHIAHSAHQQENIAQNVIN